MYVKEGVAEESKGIAMYCAAMASILLNNFATPF
jgi:hypothetical protein